jgi:hypothetical protein
VFRSDSENNNQEESGEEESIQGKPSSNNGIEADGKRERRGVDAEQASELFPNNCETKSRRREIEESELIQSKQQTAHLLSEKKRPQRATNARTSQ